MSILYIGERLWYSLSDRAKEQLSRRLNIELIDDEEYKLILKSFNKVIGVQKKV